MYSGTERNSKVIPTNQNRAARFALFHSDSQKHERDVNQLESSKYAERNINPYDIERQEGAVSKINQSDSSNRNNLEFGKTSLSPKLTQYKAALISLILERIPAQLIDIKIFHVSNREFNLPSIGVHADKQTVMKADQNRPKRRRSDGGSQQFRLHISVSNLRRNNAKMLANFRLKRSTKAARVSIMVKKVNSRATRSIPIVSDDKRSFTTGLSDILLAELTLED